MNYANLAHPCEFYERGFVGLAETELRAAGLTMERVHPY